MDYFLGDFMLVKTVFLDDSYVSCKYDKKMGTIVIEANDNGFKSLSNIFAQFADSRVSCDNTEVFLDPNCKEVYGELDSSSDSVLIMKVPNT